MSVASANVVQPRDATRPVAEAVCCAHCSLPVPASRRAGFGEQFCCFGCRMVHGLRRAGEADDRGVGPGQSALLLRMGGGIFLTMNIMVFSYFFYARESWDVDGGAASADHALVAGLLSHLLLLLCTGVVVLLGAPLAGNALSRLRHGIDTSVLILIGVAAAYVLSAVHTFRGSGGLYYDTAAMILLLVTVGSYLDSGARRRAMLSAEALAESVPDVATVERDGRVELLPVEQLRIDDVVLVKAGQRVPVDAVVIEGDSYVNEQTLTGEAQPRAVSSGDHVLAGAINVDGMLRLRATRIGDDRTIVRMRHLLAEARLLQPAVQRLADRIASVFVPLVMVLAVAVFAWHAVAGEPTEGMLIALSVLLISCPCALGLSAPLATWCALSRAARCGILVDSGATLERIAHLRQVYFDKTGTLTTGAMRLKQITPMSATSADELLRIAAAIESTSSHPIARAILNEAAARKLALPAVQKSTVLPGRGIEATVDGRTYQLGSPRLLPDAVGESSNDTVIFLLREGDPLARFTLRESIRDDAAATIQRLHGMGVRCHMLTGDQPAAARRVATALDIPFDAAMLPAAKVRQLVAAGARSAMVGDGLNDAPSLAAADVGITVAGGTDLARQAGNVHLLTDQLRRVADTLAIARHTMRRIRFNLAWAFGYNVVGITLAVMGLLSPIFAASAMVLSSLFVITSSRGAGDVVGSQGAQP
jgi:heavy metal translocating P-type ATPase